MKFGSLRVDSHIHSIYRNRQKPVQFSPPTWMDSDDISTSGLLENLEEVKTIATVQTAWKSDTPISRHWLSKFFPLFFLLFLSSSSSLFPCLFTHNFCNALSSIPLLFFIFSHLFPLFLQMPSFIIYLFLTPINNIRILKNEFLKIWIFADITVWRISSIYEPMQYSRGTIQLIPTF